jgi:hypothetical protein
VDHAKASKPAARTSSTVHTAFKRPRPSGLADSPHAKRRLISRRSSDGTKKTKQSAPTRYLGVDKQDMALFKRLHALGHKISENEAQRREIVAKLADIPFSKRNEVMQKFAAQDHARSELAKTMSTWIFNPTRSGNDFPVKVTQTTIVETIEELDEILSSDDDTEKTAEYKEFREVDLPSDELNETFVNESDDDEVFGTPYPSGKHPPNIIP